jgi:hypothetical protein
VFLRNISLGYPSANISTRASKLYVYSVELTEPDQIGQSEYLVAESTGGDVSDGTGLFGTGTYQRTFNFNAGALVPGSKYYVYFDVDQHLRVQGSSPYAGGNAQDDAYNDLPFVSAQFQAEMYT